MRLIAIFFVIFIHTDKDGIGYYAYETNSTLRWIYLGISQIAYIAVPIFFMISGATLLGKNETKARVWRKRILRFFLILVTVSLFYYVFFLVFEQRKMSVSEIFNSIYGREMIVPLWYLYAYIAFLSMLPLLRKMVQNMSASDFVYFGVIAFLLTDGIPALDYLLFQYQCTLNSYLKGALYTSVSITYPIMGYYFEHVMPAKLRNWKTAVVGILLSGVCILTGAYLTLAKAGYHGAAQEEIHGYFTSLLVLPTWTLYLCTKILFDSVLIPQKLRRVLTALGGTTFGIYLLDTMIRHRTMFVFDFLNQVFPSPIASLLWAFCSFVLGAGIVTILKKIPGIRLLF